MLFLSVKNLNSSYLGHNLVIYNFLIMSSNFCKSMIP
jgi:hypothetical protein